MNSDTTVRYDCVPDTVDDTEPLHRRISAVQVKPDGKASSGAFTDNEMSVDRANYRTMADSLAGYPAHGLARLMTSVARQHGQDVVARKQLLNPAHAEVHGKKTRAKAKDLARASEVVVIPPTKQTGPTDSKQEQAPGSEVAE